MTKRAGRRSLAWWLAYRLIWALIPAPLLFVISIGLIGDVAFWLTATPNQAQIVFVQARMEAIGGSNLRTSWTGFVFAPLLGVELKQFGRSCNVDGQFAVFGNEYLKDERFLRVRFQEFRTGQPIDVFARELGIGELECRRFRSPDVLRLVLFFPLVAAWMLILRWVYRDF